MDSFEDEDYDINEGPDSQFNYSEKVYSSERRKRGIKKVVSNETKYTVHMSDIQLENVKGEEKEEDVLSQGGTTRAKRSYQTKYYGRERGSPLGDYNTGVAKTKTHRYQTTMVSSPPKQR